MPGLRDGPNAVLQSNRWGVRGGSGQKRLHRLEDVIHRALEQATEHRKLGTEIEVEGRPRDFRLGEDLGNADVVERLLI